jgi:hypothetical protein
MYNLSSYYVLLSRSESILYVSGSVADGSLLSLSLNICIRMKEPMRNRLALSVDRKKPFMQWDKLIVLCALTTSFELWINLISMYIRRKQYNKRLALALAENPMI